MLCPVYSVKYFRDGYYKLIRFNTPRIPRLPTPREAFGDAEKKLSQAIARARSLSVMIGIISLLVLWMGLSMTVMTWTLFVKYSLNGSGIITRSTVVRYVIS